MTFGQYMGATLRSSLEEVPGLLQLGTEHSGVGGQSMPPTQEVRAVHRVEGSAEPGRHTSRSNGRGAVNKLLQGVVLASALGSALCSNYVGQVVSANFDIEAWKAPSLETESAFITPLRKPDHSLEQRMNWRSEDPFKMILYKAKDNYDTQDDDDAEI